MSTERVDRLLEQLNSGDTAAAEQVFRTYEPYLRMMVRRQLSAPICCITSATCRAAR